MQNVLKDIWAALVLLNLKIALIICKKGVTQCTTSMEVYATSNTTVKTWPKLLLWHLKLLFLQM